MHRRIRLSAAIGVQNIMTRLHLVADALLLQLIPNNIFFCTMRHFSAGNKRLKFKDANNLLCSEHRQRRLAAALIGFTVAFSPDFIVQFFAAFFRLCLTPCK